MEICQRTLLECASRGVFPFSECKSTNFSHNKKAFSLFFLYESWFLSKKAGYTLYNICPDKNHEKPHIPCGTLLGSRGVSHNVGCTRPLSHVFSSRFYQKWQWFLRNFKENAYFRTKYNNKIVARLARREQDRHTCLIGLCRAAANFRASECNRACSYCRAQPKMSRKGALYELF